MAQVHLCGCFHGSDWRSDVASVIHDLGHMVTEAGFEYGSRYKEIVEGEVYRPPLKGLSSYPDRVSEIAAWEIESIDASDICVFVFTSGSLRPDGLAMLGYAAGKGKRVHVFCEPKFFRASEVEAISRALKLDFHPGYGLDEVMMAAERWDEK